MSNPEINQNHHSNNLIDVINLPVTSVEKSSQINALYGIQLSPTNNSLEKWANMISPENPLPLNSQHVKTIIKKYQALDNIENYDSGQKASHKLLVNYLFPNELLPCLTAIYNYAQESKDSTALQSSSLSLVILNDALNILIPDDKKPLTSKLSTLQTESMRTGSTTLQEFYALMALARQSATEAISINLDKPIKFTDNFPLSPDIKLQDYDSVSTFSLEIVKELNQGLDFPKLPGQETELLTQIKNSKALCLSIDYNSVMNQHESYANSLLTSFSVDLFKILSDKFQQKFPDKQMLLVINTGRPALYAWGVLETLSVLKEMRVFGLAESGGVILKNGISKGETQVAVENPKTWDKLLNKLKDHLLDNILSPNEVHIEPKQSMLSIRLAPNNTTNWLHHDLNHKPITDTWIKDNVTEFLNNKSTSLNNDKKETQEIIKSFPNLETTIKTALTAIGIEGIDQTIDTLDDLTPEKKTQVEHIFSTYLALEFQKLKDIKLSLKTLNLMQKKLKSDFNQKAGYIDIHHQDLNKYSTLQQTIQQELHFKPNQVAFIAIGDSNTDIIPSENTDPGEINEGADQVMLVAVRNASPDLMKDVMKRIPTRKAVYSHNESILGLISLVQGLTRLI